ncbi:MAG: ATP-dependent Clp protease ATP-binding subunit [Minisyncoccia bacterium]|jgi:ATP-dependent Clp protease ATP-binding subunit ClpB
MPFAKFTNKAQAALERAQQMAWERHQGEMRALHLFYTLLDDEETSVRDILNKGFNLDIEALMKDILEEIIKLPRIFVNKEEIGQMYLSPEIIQILETASKKSTEDKNDYVSCEYLLYGIIATNNSASDIIKKYQLDKDKYLEALHSFVGEEKSTDEFTEPTGSILEKYSQDLVALAKSNKLDPVIGREKELLRVMQILSRRTKNNPILIGEAGVGKTAIVEGLAQKIAQNDVPEILKNKRIISLDLGALIAGTRFRGEFEERFKKVLKEIQKDPTIITFIDEIHTLVGAGAAEGAIDASNLLKPALARGELRLIGATTYRDYREHIEKDPAFERRFQTVVVEEPSQEEAIAILRGLKEKYEAHHGLKISDDAIVAAVQLSVRYITDRYLPDKAIDLIDEAASLLSLEIGSTPLPILELERQIKNLELEKEALKKEENLGERLKEIDKELKKLKKKYDDLVNRWTKEKELFLSIAKIKKELEESRSLAQQEERNGNLEKVAEIVYGKIPQLEKELTSLERVLNKIPGKDRFFKEIVTREDVARVVSRWTGIPVTEILEDEMQKLSRMEEILSQRVVGQDEAIKAISRAIRRARAGLSEEDRPLGSFMFLGPTGVGKTELARALAEFMFNDEKALVRIDMSEYMEKYSVARLIGSPPGYVGYEEGGQLTEIVKHRPYSLILFDEIEKAHPEVFNILLQVLDNGRLTDGKGRTVNFRNTIIIMTSNLGGEYIKEIAGLGFAYGNKENNDYKNQKEKLEAKILEALQEFFRPEFLNRIDDIIIFNPLTPKNIEKIVEIQINKIIKRVGAKGIILEFTKEAKKYLAQKGYDPNFGARPLKRLIEKEVVNPLADKIISQEIKSNDLVIIDESNGRLIIKTKK